MGESGCPEKSVSGQVLSVEGGNHGTSQIFSQKFLSASYYLVTPEISDNQISQPEFFRSGV
jgi:hypothetical protein